MYEVRCTISKFARVARGSGGRWDLPMYEVRRRCLAAPMYDVRLRNSRALRGEAEQKRHGIFYATTGRG